MPPAPSTSPLGLFGGAGGEAFGKKEKREKEERGKEEGEEGGRRGKGRRRKKGGGRPCSVYSRTRLLPTRLARYASIWT